MVESAKNGKESAELPVPSQMPELPPTDPASFELRIIDPKQTRIFRQKGVVRLTIVNDRSWIKVSVARAFPLSNPDHYLGFLDGAGKDIGLLHDPALLDPDSRRIVDEELEKRYFVPIVERVITVKEEFGTIYWSVETDRGEKEVIVRNLRDNLQDLGSSRVIITDVDGNRFEFSDITKLDSKSQGILLRNL